MISLSHQQQSITFDFEEYVKQMLPTVELDQEGLLAMSNPFDRSIKIKPKVKTVVCKHWLLGLCQNGSNCEWLHRLNRSKMSECKHGKLCKIKNCHLKHIDEQDVLECIFFKQGFCYNGPNCVRRHIKRLPDECPKEASFEQAVSVGAGVQNPLFNKKIKSSQRNENYKSSLCANWLSDTTSCQYLDGCHYAHGEDQISDTIIQNNDILNDLNIYDPRRNIMNHDRLNLPLPPNAKVSYFLCQAPDLRCLAMSKRRGVWAVPSKNAAEINAAIRSSDVVVLYFCCRSLKGLYGVAKISGAIPIAMNPNALISPEFPVSWIRTTRVSLRTVAQLKTGN
jgi:cleavage and polyadenylation specificity factor subunit 4